MTNAEAPTAKYRMLKFDQVWGNDGDRAVETMNEVAAAGWKVIQIIHSNGSLMVFIEKESK